LSQTTLDHNTRTIQRERGYQDEANNVAESRLQLPKPTTQLSECGGAADPLTRARYALTTFLFLFFCAKIKKYPYNWIILTNKS